MDPLVIIERVSVVLGLIYLVLLIRENIWCWIFGIVSSLLSIYLFWEVNLRSEAVLYLYYVIIGIYGWYRWTKPKTGKSLKLHEWSLKRHLIAIVIGIVAAFGMGTAFERWLNADYSLVDAHTTIFSFIASYLEANKVISGWVYWIIINGVSIWLYYIKGLEAYPWLMVIYFVMSIFGLLSWKRKSRAVATAV